MGEGDRGAGSLHFFVPALRRGGCGCGRSGSGSGSHAPPGKPGRKPVPFIFCVRPRERGGGDAAEAEAKHRPTRETVKRPFVLPDPAQGRTSPPSEAVSQASPPLRENGGQPRKRVVRRCCIGISGLCPRGVRSAERAPEVPLRPETPVTVTGTRHRARRRARHRIKGCARSVPGRRSHRTTRPAAICRTQREISSSMVP